MCSAVYVSLYCLEENARQEQAYLENSLLCLFTSRNECMISRTAWCSNHWESPHYHIIIADVPKVIICSLRLLHLNTHTHTRTHTHTTAHIIPIQAALSMLDTTHTHTCVLVFVFGKAQYEYTGQPRRAICLLEFSTICPKNSNFVGFGKMGRNSHFIFKYWPTLEISEILLLWLILAKWVGFPLHI